MKYSLHTSTRRLSTKDVVLSLVITTGIPESFNRLTNASAQLTDVFLMNELMNRLPNQTVATTRG